MIKYFQITQFDNKKDAEKEIAMYQKEAKELPIINFGLFNIMHHDKKLLELFSDCKNLDFIKVIEAQKNILPEKMASNMNIFTFRKKTLFARCKHCEHMARRWCFEKK